MSSFFLPSRCDFKKALAEGLGTFMIVFTGCGAVMISERFSGSIPSLAIPVIFGLTVAIMIYALGHISGAHFNPAVTLAFTIARHFPAHRVIPYLVAQFLGAVAAVWLLVAILPAGSGFGATIPNVPTFAAVVWEFVLTFLLMFVIISVATDTRAVGTMAGVAIGGAVTVSAFVGGPLTGASMNPARSFGPALWAGVLDTYWIYVVGPILGAVSAAVFYQWIRDEHRCPSGPESTEL